MSNENEKTHWNGMILAQLWNDKLKRKDWAMKTEKLNETQNLRVETEKYLRKYKIKKTNSRFWQLDRGFDYWNGKILTMKMIWTKQQKEQLKGNTS